MITTSSDEHILTITLDRAEKHNALNREITVSPTVSV